MMIKRRSLLIQFAAVTASGCAGVQNSNMKPFAAIVLHGKRDLPQNPINADMRWACRDSSTTLTPMMSWSTYRYWDSSVEDAHEEISALIQNLRSSRHENIVLVGHSTGGNVALSYAATRGDVSAVVMLAPGHSPRRIVQQTTALTNAKSMVADGRGDDIGVFMDNTLGSLNHVRMKAKDYVSWFDPDGLAEMAVTAPRLSPNIPVFMAVGSNDMPWLQDTHETVFPLLPKNPNSRALVVGAGHAGVPRSATDEMRTWFRVVFAA